MRGGKKRHGRTFIEIILFPTLSGLLLIGIHCLGFVVFR